MFVLIWIARHAVEILAGWVALTVFTLVGVSWALSRGKRQQQAIPCLCGCPGTVHEHFRDGDDCGRCGKKVCAGYRPDLVASGNIKPPAVFTPGATVRIDGDEHGRLITYQAEGFWGPTEPDVTSCRRNDNDLD